MYYKKGDFVNSKTDFYMFGGQRKRYFFKFLFGRKMRDTPSLRPGAMFPDVLKKEIQNIGAGKIVEILRIGYDGRIDDVPVIIKLIHIGPDSFSGKIVNVERQFIEENSQKAIYAKRGGGVIEFRYLDGDIKDVILSADADELEAARDTSGLKEILSALEINDRILVAYFDRIHRGTVNLEGVLTNRSGNGKAFDIRVDRINGVQLDKMIEKKFNIDSDVVVDISIV